MMISGHDFGKIKIDRPTFFIDTNKTKLTLLFLEFHVFHICLGIFLLELQFQIFIPMFVFEILGLGLDHSERCESEERRWLGEHRWLPLQLLRYLPQLRRRHTRLQVCCTIGKTAVVVGGVVAVRDMLICAELVGFRILLQLVRLVGPVLAVLEVVMVVMELHFLLFVRRLLPFVS